MASVYLLTMLTCGLYSCNSKWDIFPTLARCEVALSLWKDHTPFWPFSYSHNGFCIKRTLSDEDINTYLHKGDK